MNRLLLVSALVLLANHFIECIDESKIQRKLANCKSKATDIGDYSNEINGYNECGISMNTSQLKSTCTGANQQLSKRLNGVRDAVFGEAPWMVYLKMIFTKTKSGWCGGALISDQWVLTAAHCLVTEDIQVYFDMKNKGEGHSIEVVKKLKHPKFTNNPGAPGYTDHDVALIKLKQSINDVTEIDAFKRNIICLPSRNFNAIKEGFYTMATISGIGPDHDQLQIGQVNLYKESTNALAQDTSEFPTIICSGDSGSPVWLYNMGKAFLIGVNSNIVDNEKNGVCSKYGRSSFVPEHIDWILETIKQ